MVKISFFSGKKKRVFLQSQYAAGAAMMLTSMTHGAFNGWAIACVPLLRSEHSPLKLNDSQLSWVVSIQFLGNMFSAIPAGLLMDMYGCKNILVFSEIIPLTSWLLLFLTNYFHHWQLMILSRFLSGIWIGMNNTTVPLYISEIAEPHVRGFLNTMYNVCFRLGSLYALVTALFVPYTYLPPIYAIFIVIFLFLLPVIPETPQYHIKKNDLESAKESLQCIRPDKTESEIETELKALQISVNKQMESKGHFKDLLATKGTRRALFIVESLTIMQKLAGLSSIVSYLSITLPNVMTLTPAILVVIIESLRLCSSFTSSLIYDRVGARVLLLTTSSFCGVMMFCTGLWYKLDSTGSASSFNPSDYTWIPFVCILLHGIGYSLGLLPVCSNIKGEFFPVNVKGKCSALTCTTVAFTSFVVSKMYLLISNQFGIYTNFWIYSVTSFAIVVFANHFLIETKGKTLQDIQDELNTKRSTSKTKQLDIKL